MTTFSRFVAIALLMVGSAYAQFPLPALSGRVMDKTNTLSTAEVQAINSRLASIEQQYGSQIVVLMLPTTAPEDIAAFSYRVADAWKIGRKKIGDGVLIVVAKDDRRVRIEIAKALEGAIPDVLAGRIIQEYIKPAFAAQQYAQGITAALDALTALIAKEDLPPPVAPVNDDEELPPWLSFIGAAMVFFPLINGIMGQFFGRKLGALFTGGLSGAVIYIFFATLIGAAVAGLLAFIAGLLFKLPMGGRSYQESYGRGYGGGGFPGGFGGRGGGRGGGFSSGGGGSFGGGGASGSW